MPLVRITMMKGRPPAEVRRIADGVHAALVETFDVPRQDRFQVVEQVEREALIYDPSYLDVARTDGIVVVHILASASRTTAQKRALYRAVADRLSADAGVRREDVQVILAPNERADWSFGNGVASYAPQD